jgi:diaminopimelate epimerase
MIPFYKMHANGNDFMIIDGWHDTIPLPSSTIVHQWADRQTGVGFDQLLHLTRVENHTIADAACRIFNASGSEAEHCGHGMACLAQLLYRKGYVSNPYYRITTPAGVCTVQRLDDERAIVDLGYPVLQPERVPFLTDQPSLLYPISLSEDLDVVFKPSLHEIRRTQQESLLKLSHPEIPHLLKRIASDSSLLVSVLAIGNPHCVILVSDIENIPVQLGSRLSAHTTFPKGSNVEFMQIVDRNHIRVRVYERGVGENRACGSGACAAMVIGRVLGYLDPIVSVQFPAGDRVTVRWIDFDATVQLETSTQFVFQGEVSGAV